MSRQVVLFTKKRKSMYKFFVHLEIPQSFYQDVQMGHRVTEWPIVAETCLKITYSST